MSAVTLLANINLTNKLIRLQIILTKHELISHVLTAVAEGKSKKKQRGSNSESEEDYAGTRKLIVTLAVQTLKFICSAITRVYRVFTNSGSMLAVL